MEKSVRTNQRNPQLERCGRDVSTPVGSTPERKGAALGREGKSPVPSNEYRRSGVVPAIVFASDALQCGANFEGREFSGIRMQLVGVDAVAMVLQVGSDQRSVHTG